MKTAHQDVMDDLDALIAGDEAAIARHAEHLAGCDECRDARHDAAMVAERIKVAGADYVASEGLVERVMGKLEDGPRASGLGPRAEEVAHTSAPKPVAARPE